MFKAGVFRSCRVQSFTPNSQSIFFLKFNLIYLTPLISPTTNFTLDVPIQMKLISQKKLCKRQSKKQDSKQQKLKQLWTAYENHDIITSDYLKQYSSLADHGED